MKPPAKRRRETFASPRGVLKISRILALLADPMDVTEIAVALHMGRTTMHRYMQHLMAETPRRIYIAYWERTASHPRPFYKIGERRNAPRPRQTSSPADRWARVKSDPLKHAQRKADNRRTYRERAGLPPEQAPPRAARPAASPFAALGL